MICVDSCENMVIENCFICVGDDGIAIKSGWDQYGIAYGRPSTNILIRNVTVRSVVRLVFLNYCCLYMHVNLLKRISGYLHGMFNYKLDAFTSPDPICPMCFKM